MPFRSEIYSLYRLLLLSLFWPVRSQVGDGFCTSLEFEATFYNRQPVRKAFHSASELDY